MPLIPLTDLSDPRLAPYRALKATNETRNLPLFVVEGEKLLDWLLPSRYPLDSVLAAESHADRLASKVPPDIPLFVLPARSVSELVGYKFHQGVLACGRRVPPPSLDSLLAAPGTSTLVVLPEIHNPENLGAILRTADVFDARAVLAGPHCPDPLSRRVLRVSMGTSLRLPTLIDPDLPATLRRLRSAYGYRLLATVTDPSAQPLETVAPSHPDRLALLLGTEAHGLAPPYLSLADQHVTIPMRAGAESLNVATAAAIFLYRLSAPSGS